jgi:hypothetical protein
VRRGKYKLTIRELPPSGGYDVLHVQSLRGAIYLLGPLRRMHTEAHERAEKLGGEHKLAEAALHHAMERQALSEAIQVLSAITCEAAVNLLGLLVLGEEQFHRTIERLPTQAKLRDLVDLVAETPVNDNAALFQSLRRLMDARNEFVHPKPSEGGDVTPHRFPPSVAAAEASVRLAITFLSELTKVNGRYSSFFATR